MKPFLKHLVTLGIPLIIDLWKERQKRKKEEEKKKGPYKHVVCRTCTNRGPEGSTHRYCQLCEGEYYQQEKPIHELPNYMDIRPPRDDA